MPHSPQVGEGAYGKVMKCRVRGSDPETWVAVKEFKIEVSHREEGAERVISGRGISPSIRRGLKAGGRGW
jgi:hypothetical protein